MVKGASDGYERILELVGTGYRCEVKGKILTLALGFSHPAVVELPAAISAVVPPDSKGTQLVLTSADKALLGQTAATIRGASSAGAVRRQGHSLPRREHPPQGRQGRQGARQSRRIMAIKLTGRERRKLRIRSKISRQRRAPAPQRVPQRPAHLRPGRQRRATARRSPRPRRCRATSRARSSDDNKTDAAKKVGALIAKICLEKKIEKVVFDRNGYLYHGRVKALAEAAREAGLKF